MPSNSWANGWVAGDIPTAAEFSKGMGAIYDTTLTGAAASIDVTGIVATYAHLMIELSLRGTAAAVNVNPKVTLNNDTGLNYDWQRVSGSAAAVSTGENFATAAFNVGDLAVPAGTAPANRYGSVLIYLTNYANAADHKSILMFTQAVYGTTAGTMQAGFIGGAWRSTAAVNRVTITPSSGNWEVRSRATVYVKGA